MNFEFELLIVFSGFFIVCYIYGFAIKFFAGTVRSWRPYKLTFDRESDRMCSSWVVNSLFLFGTVLNNVCTGKTI